MGSLTRKPIQGILEEAGKSDGSLKRVLGASHLVALGVGAIIGSGIFVLTGQAAAQYAGPSITLSFILAAIASGFAGLCYAEFAAMLPIAGSAYTYAYATLGELLAWIIGWDLILEYLFGASAVAVGWSGYVNSLLKDFGLHLPAAFTGPPVNYVAGEGFVSTGNVFNLPAVLIILALTAFLVVGIQEAAWLNNVAVACKVAVILAFILFGAAFVNTQNWIPFIPPAGDNFGEFGMGGILRGAGVIFFAYIGFDAVSTTAQEAKNPQRDMPIGILGSLVICTILYMLVSLVLTGLVHYTQLNVPDPIAVGVNAAGESLRWLRYPVKLGAIAGLSSVILVLLMGQPRVFYAMSVDGLLPKALSKLHPKFKTPHLTTILTGSVAAVLAGALPIGILGEMVSIGTLLAFMLVCAGILVLRYREPERERPFRCPGVPVTPVLGVLSCLYLMIGLPWHTWERLIIWMILGLAIYFVYGRTHSKWANVD
jgi:basic amino acid/polyamine antiporter, APA family